MEMLRSWLLAFRKDRPNEFASTRWHFSAKNTFICTYFFFNRWVSSVFVFFNKEKKENRSQYRNTEWNKYDFTRPALVVCCPWLWYRIRRWRVCCKTCRCNLVFKFWITSYSKRHGTVSPSVLIKKEQVFTGLRSLFYISYRTSAIDVVN